MVLQKKTFLLSLLLAASITVSGCGDAGQADTGDASDAGQTTVAAVDQNDGSDAEQVEIEDEIVALASVPSFASTQPSGTATEKNNKAEIDYSNTGDGYVMARYTASTSARLKVEIKGPTTRYTYNLPAGQWVVFPLSDGNGSYQVTVYENVKDTKYAMVLSKSMTVSLKDEFAPFLRPNQYVDYASAPKTVAKAAELTKGKTDTLDKVQAVYDYVVGNVKYDKQLAASVRSGYLPVLDNILATNKGICLDYAALMTGMLRSQNVPCKMVTGYTGGAYHAWISVWSPEDGWIDGTIYFDGSKWQRMDPTFASNGNQSEEIMKYIGDGKNYTVKYLY